MMEQFQSSTNKLSKVSGLSDGDAAATSEKCFRAILKVRREDYVPAAVEIRMRVSPLMLTVDVPATALQALQDDPDVESVALSSPVRGIDDKAANAPG